MNTENSQEQTQTPKYKVGDLVWVPIPCNVNGSGGLAFLQTSITAVVYSRFDGKSTFEGYIPASERRYRLIQEAGIFATREDAEAFIDEIQKKAKAEMEGE